MVCQPYVWWVGVPMGGCPAPSSSSSSSCGGSPVHILTVQPQAPLLELAWRVGGAIQVDETSVRTGDRGLLLLLLRQVEDPPTHPPTALPVCVCGQVMWGPWSEVRRVLEEGDGCHGPCWRGAEALVAKAARGQTATLTGWSRWHEQQQGGSSPPPRHHNRGRALQQLEGGGATAGAAAADSSSSSPQQYGPV